MIELARLVHEVLTALAAAEERAGDRTSAQAPAPATRPFVAIAGALAAGEPRRALRLLKPLDAAADPTQQRRVRACRAWAQYLDRNWYPGDNGGESGARTAANVVDLSEGAPGDPATMLLEAGAAYGAGALLSLRVMLEQAVRKGDPAAVALLNAAIGKLEKMKDTALAAAAPVMAGWAWQSAADLVQRAGNAQGARQMLDRARAIYAQIPAPAGLVSSWLMEGDWYATPGSAPEALGLDLIDYRAPSPFAAQRDSARATQAYDQAAAALGDAPAPGTRGALALRRAFMGLLAGRLDAQSTELDAADQAFAAAGATNARHVVFMHRQVAAIQAGDMAQLRRKAPPEWALVAGPFADIAAWAERDGSASFCTGLGRILWRTAEQWEQDNDLERAEIAYLMARPLLSASGAVPWWSSSIALARLDRRRNVAVRSLARRLHVLTRLPPPPDVATDPVAWMQDLDLTVSLIEIPSGSIGTGLVAIRTIELGAQRLRTLLGLTGDVYARQTDAPLDPDAIRADLEARWAKFGYSDALQSGSDARFIETAVQFGAAQLAQSEPQLTLQRALLAERLGWDDQADLAYRAAREQLGRSGINHRWLDVLVCAAWGHHAEARAVLARIHDAPVGNERSLEAILSLRARDFIGAHRLFQQMDSGQDVGALTWIGLLDRAEATLECADAAAARDLAARGIDRFEAEINRLPSDVDRVLAGDDIKAAALYQMAARACLVEADRCAQRADAAGAAAARAQGFAFADRGQALALPRLEGSAGSIAPGEHGAFNRWQQATTEQATAYQRYLAALTLGGDVSLQDLAQSLAHAEQNVADIEAALPTATASATTERAFPRTGAPAPGTAPIPPGVVLLQYQLVGRDLVAWCATHGSIEGTYRRLSGRPLDGAISRLLRACAAGDPGVEAGDLAALLLEPFGAQLDRNERVIVVPFGALHAVPFHALPFRGEPLGATHVVSYLPAASLLADGGVDRPLAGGGALVVGDPAFDPVLYPSLRRLPGAALEGSVVAKLHRTADVFAADLAREPALRPLLGGRAVLHFAAHGRLDDIAPNTSSIVLAGSDQLTVSDLVGLRLESDLAVLSACDTGRGAISLGGGLVGLTRGLLAAGVRRSVVSLWPVDDVAACITMVGFHERLLRGDAPALALAKAQRDVRATPGPVLIERYRALGGVVQPGARSVRRKSAEPGRNAVLKRMLPAFPETDLDDPPAAAAEENHGALASMWAPFVLIGC